MKVTEYPHKIGCGTLRMRIGGIRIYLAGIGGFFPGGRRSGGLPGHSPLRTHKREIDDALTAGKSLRSLAAQYGVSVSALFRHTNHLRRALANGAEEAQQLHHIKLLDKLDLFDFRLERIYQKAQDYNCLHICLVQRLSMGSLSFLAFRGAEGPS